ncbi:MAG: HD domain-containing protein [Bacteroidetes bacterium]|nr:HD domain-containing protein [Bacteroidota bacterium]
MQDQDQYQDRVNYDPLYGAITFRVERLGLKDFWAQPDPLLDSPNCGELAKYIEEILSCYEFHRLNFLTQAGLSWLAFPSATHTRFSHSLGCWFLGEQALDSVQIIRHDITQKTESKMFLIDFLRQNNLQEEFMLSLLLHDVGHFPFSHIFEHNLKYSDFRHEEIGAQFIMGKGEIFDLFIIKIREENGNSEFRSNFLSEVLEKLSESVLNRKIVCFLITGNPDYIKDVSDTMKRNVRLLRELVSGVIDLDRIDHYHRDSTTMGLKIGVVNPMALLSGLKLSHDFNQDNIGIRLSDNSIMQAMSLLMTRDMLQRLVFDNPIIVGYESMLNYAINQVVENEGEKKLEFLIWSDGELLNFLLHNNYSPSAVNMVTRIIHGLPYERIGKYEIKNPDYNSIKGIQQIKIEIIEYLRGKGFKVRDEDILIRYPPTLVKQRNSSTLWKEWFDMERLQDINGNTLAHHHGYEKQIEFLTKQYSAYDRIVQFFASAKNIASETKDFLDTKGYIYRIN